MRFRLLVLLITIVLLTACSSDQAETALPELPTKTPKPTSTPLDTATPTLTDTPTPTFTPAPTLISDQYLDLIMEADIQYQEAEFEAAIETYTEILSYSLDNEQRKSVYILRAYAYDDVGDRKAALDDYLKAYEFGDSDVSLLNNICWDYALVGQPEKGLPYCEDVVEKEPSAYVIDSRGLTYALMGDYESAAKDFQEVVDFLENETDVILMSMYHSRMEWLEALQDGENPFTPEEIDELSQPDYLIIANRLVENEMYDAAIRVLTEKIEQDPNKIEAYYMRGLAYTNLDKTEHARADFKKVIDSGYESAENIQNILTPTQFPKAMIDWEALNLPFGFESFYPKSIGIEEGVVAYSGGEGVQRIEIPIVNSFYFADDLYENEIYGYAFVTPKNREQSFINHLITNIMDITEVVVLDGIKAKDVSELNEINNIGDKSSAVTMLFPIEDKRVRLEQMLFKMGDIGGSVFIRYIDGKQPPTKVDKLAEVYARSINNSFMSCKILSITPITDYEYPAFQINAGGFYPGEGRKITISGHYMIGDKKISSSITKVGETEDAPRADSEGNISEEMFFSGVIPLNEEEIEYLEFDISVYGHFSQCEVQETITWPGE